MGRKKIPRPGTDKDWIQVRGQRKCFYGGKTETELLSFSFSSVVFFSFSFSFFLYSIFFFSSPFFFLIFFNLFSFFFFFSLPRRVFCVVCWQGELNNTDGPYRWDAAELGGFIVTKVCASRAKCEMAGRQHCSSSSLLFFLLLYLHGR
ncbi:hypothetical protein BGZ63DRAFT_181092 [Mariannaea sp. PMI_226]|nr:hypothetical protein BGZ63DRAFT_181092 [Mariannaea sp. PMI_226]